MKPLFKNFTAIAAVGFLWLILAGTASADNGASKRYAREAVRQNQQNIQLKAGFTGPAWTSDYDAHYNWSIRGQNVKSTPDHMAAREKQLQEYAVKHLSREAAGKRYATEAVRQFKASQEMRTGFKPPVWSGDYNAHYNWIMHGQNINQSARHLADREKQLQQYAVDHGFKGAATKVIQGTVTKIYTPPKVKVIQGAKMQTPSARLPEKGKAAYLNKANALINGRLEHAGTKLTPAGSPIFDIPVGEDVAQPVQIGKGYNSLLKKPTFPAVEIPQSSIQTLHVNKVHSESDYVRSMEDYYKHLGVDVKASGSYMGFSGSNQTHFETNEQNHKYHERFVAYVHAQTALEFTSLVDLKLNPKARNVLKNQGVNEFYRQYGDCFVYAIQYGAGLRAVATYQLFKHDKAFKFSNKTTAGGDWVIGGFDVSVDVEKESRTQKENEQRNITFDPFGAYTKHPNSISELRDIVGNFAQNAGLLAQQSTANNKFGGVIYYTVMKYSELPEFQQIAGANALNIEEQRKLLDQLSYYQRKIQFMLNNLRYVTAHPGEFDPQKVQSAKTHSADLMKYLTSVEHDMAILQQFPLDRSKWRFNPDNYRYDQIPQYAPDTRYVTVKVNFPADYRSAPASAEHDWGKDHVGPLIGYNHTKGDNDTHGAKIDINMHTRLEIQPGGKAAYLRFDFLEKENRPDYTTFQGTKTLKVYQVPEGYTIVGFKKSTEDYYLRDLNRNAPYTQGPVILNVNAVLRDKNHFKNYPVQNPLWTNLNVIFDTSGGDYEVGVFGDLEFKIGLKENQPGY